MHYALVDNIFSALIWLIVVPIAFVTVEQWSGINIIEISCQKIERMIIIGFIKRSRQEEDLEQKDKIEGSWIKKERKKENN